VNTVLEEEVSMDQISALSAGSPAPDFDLPDLLAPSAGPGIRLSDFRGQVVIVDFWSAECSWSERSDQEILPRLKDWQPGVTWLPVASNDNETEEELRQMAISRGLPRLLRDDKHRVADQYGAQTTPHFFVIDDNGLLRYQGSFDNVTFRQRTPSQAYLIPAVLALLDGQEPAVASAPAYGCTIVRFPEE
jgi:peroxiredoxin